MAGGGAPAILAERCVMLAERAHLRCGCQAQLGCRDHGPCPVIDVQSLQDGRNVQFHGALREMQDPRDLLVRFALAEKREHFALAWRQERDRVFIREGPGAHVCRRRLVEQGGRKIDAA